MSTINSKNVQVGTSGTASQNFTLYQPASPDGTVRLGVGNSGATSADVITATSAGNVGIGTSSPSVKLDVNGICNFGGSLGVRAGIGTAFATGQAELYAQGAVPLGVGTAGNTSAQFYTNSTERMRIDSSGNVGIGTTTIGSTGVSLAGTYNIGWTQSAGESIPNIFRQASSAALVLADGYRYTGTSNGFASSFSSSYAKCAISCGTVAGAITFYTDTAATVAAGTDVTPTERMRIDTSGNVGIGTNSPTDTNGFGRVLDVQSSTGAALFVRDSDSPTTLHAYFGFLGSNSSTYVWNKANGPMLFATNDAERARITSDGDFLLGTTLVGNSGSNCRMQIAYPGGSTKFGLGFRPAADNTSPIQFGNASGVTVGTISTSSTATAYNTSSDYRLKEAIAPMTGALAKVTALKPVTYIWKSSGEASEGFIAHELAEVVPQCVTGEKDAVDAEGNPVYQGIDTSFLVATLTAAIQELTAKVAALEAKLGAQA